MDYKDWKLAKKDLDTHLDEYSQASAWCNANGFHIEDAGEYYTTAINPPLPEPTIEEQVIALEEKYHMVRWQREGILADGSTYSEYIKARAQEIEDLAEQLRN